VSNTKQNDFAKIRKATSDLYANDDVAWAAFNWIFCSSELDERGFCQTAKRIGVNPTELTDKILLHSENARKFFYGTEEPIEDSTVS
jgi:hypothetical protein